MQVVVREAAPSGNLRGAGLVALQPYFYHPGAVSLAAVLKPPKWKRDINLISKVTGT